MPSVETSINESNFEELLPLRELILEKYDKITKPDNEILNLMKEEENFEQGSDLKTNFTIYFKSCYFRRDKSST